VVTVHDIGLLRGSSSWESFDARGRHSSTVAHPVLGVVACRWWSAWRRLGAEQSALAMGRKDLSFAWGAQRTRAVRGDREGAAGARSG
jgi:hypothetical protein